MSSPSEFAFELALCSHLEQTTDWLPARQLGAAVASPGSRIIDICAVVPGPAFTDRTRITDRDIPATAIESDVGVGRAVFWRDAFDCPPARARRATDRAVEVGFFESEHRRSREYVRRATRYPGDWFSRLVGIENKPDLGEPGDLLRQLRLDVSLALFDEVVLATESYVTGAHLNRIPDQVGVWRFDPETGEREVVRDAEPLTADATGVEPVEYHSLHTDVALVPPADKRTARLRLAERAYGKGWRGYDLPACTHAGVDADGRPVCEHFGRVVDPGSECGTECTAFEPADPPELDRAELREARTGWVADPTGITRRQSGLDRFW
ncbi:hypothetical protein E6P09_01720 [Haloferax mediterranei ATCC 33500]|uniref:Uncharacterized protein n=1 Tax=Haloferax mediterranei (strain ATCC 33500 / DSM 1411 / JCM 8866 / NBRC 14739 / NCIMB 2177 / R-4) TaxID=523841 RepID=M0IW58_HALMT|nr:hypothetical protein C439_11753 [Haloferax mediterranei ATCC 33500]QCQ76555.1 hypothetical protein E6P09_01720 [Haloferax mediterranei ATCC 33500]